MRSCMRAQIRVGKGARRAKLFISLELGEQANVSGRFEQGRTQQTENMDVATVLSELSSDICRFQQTDQTSLDVNERVFLYSGTKLQSPCAKVKHLYRETTKSITNSIK